jgi:hypothetical protein
LWREDRSRYRRPSGTREVASQSGTGGQIGEFAAKELVNLIADGGEAAAAYERWAAQWRLSADGVEGPAAFLARRQPAFP